MTAPKILMLTCNYNCCLAKARIAGIPRSRIIYVHHPDVIRQLGHGTRGMERRIAPCFENRVNARQIRDCLMTHDLDDAPTDQVPANAAPAQRRL